MRFARAARNAFAVAVVVAVTATALSACGHAATKEAASRGAIVVDDAAARDVLRTCSRPSPDRKGELPLWTPAPGQIAALERALPTLAPQVGDADAFARQYVGIVKDGMRLIYVNAWPKDDGPFTDADGKPLDFTREAMRVCDGGKSFWGVLWNPGTGEFSDFQANGQI